MISNSPQSNSQNTTLKDQPSSTKMPALFGGCEGFAGKSPLQNQSQFPCLTFLEIPKNLLSRETSASVSGCGLFPEDVKCLKPFLLKLFKNEVLGAADIPAGQRNRVILATLAQRKWDLALAKCSSAEIAAKVSAAGQQKSKKRKEENKKFVFKLILKKLRRAYLEHHKELQNKRKSDIDLALFSHYFSGVSKNLNLSVEDFYLPGSTVKGKASSKSFTSRYIGLLKQSAQFTQDFARELLRLNDTQIDQMIEKKVAKFLDVLARFGAEPSQTDQMVNYIEKNTKGKLPWTKLEIQNAVQTVKQTFFDPGHSNSRNF